MSVQKKFFDRQPLIVGVGSPDDVRSSIWRLWIHKDDVYFGTIESLRGFKVSLHQSGIWRAAFVRSLDGETDRAARRWQRPDADEAGMTHAIAAAVSPLRPQKPFKQPRVNDQRIRWVAPAAANNVVILFVSIANDGIDTEPNHFVNDTLVGRLRKANGEMACLVAHERVLTHDLATRFREVMAGVKFHVDQKITDTDVHASRALLFNAAGIIGPANPPSLFDVELGWENVVSKHG